MEPTIIGQIEIPGYIPNNDLPKYRVTYNLINGIQGEKSFRAVDEWRAFCMFVDWMGRDTKFITDYKIEQK